MKKYAESFRTYLVKQKSKSALETLDQAKQIFSALDIFIKPKPSTPIEPEKLEESSKMLDHSVENILATANEIYENASDERQRSKRSFLNDLSNKLSHLSENMDKFLFLEDQIRLIAIEMATSRYNLKDEIFYAIINPQTKNAVIKVFGDKLVEEMIQINESYKALIKKLPSVSPSPKLT